MRCMAQADLTNHLWSSISCLENNLLTITSTSADPRSMSPLDTYKFKVREDEDVSHHDPWSNLHLMIHRLSKKNVVVHLSNHNTSWLASRRELDSMDRFPAYDTNCTMFAENGDIVSLNAPYDEFQAVDQKDLSGAKAVILPNRSCLLMANTVETAVMRAIYFDFSVSALMRIESTGGMSHHNEASEDEIKRRNSVWNNDDVFRNCPEIDLLERRMKLPDWWAKVDVSEFNDDNVDELTLLAARDLAPNTTIARVGGCVVPESNKYTIRLANNRHLLMSDVPNSVNRQVPSVFSYINHSFRPNVRCIPDPNGECVVFETLRRIESGESLSFDYTSTEEPLFAEPFVDIETGRPVGMDK